jgi:hypothetical protein
VAIFETVSGILPYSVILRREQLDDLEANASQAFLLQAIADWYAIYKQVYGHSPSLSFDQSWDFGELVLDELSDVAWNPHSDCCYEILHKVLTAAEHGVPDESIESALMLFAEAMPSEVAAMAILDMELQPGTANPGKDLHV